MTAAAAAAEAQGSGRVYCATVRAALLPHPPSTLAALDYWEPESSARPDQTARALREKSTETAEARGSRPAFSFLFPVLSRDCEKAPCHWHV